MTKKNNSHLISRKSKKCLCRAACGTRTTSVQGAPIKNSPLKQLLYINNGSTRLSWSVIFYLHHAIAEAWVMPLYFVCLSGGRICSAIAWKLLHE